MDSKNTDIEKDVELPSLLLDIAKPIMESRKEWKRREQTKRQEEEGHLAALQAEYKKLLQLTRHRISLEESACENITQKILPLLEEIQEFATKYAIFPPKISAEGGPPIPPYSNASVFVKKNCNVTLPDENQIPDTEGSLKKNIQKLSEVHVSSEFGLGWKFLETESGYSRGEYGMSQYWSTTDIVTYGIKVELRSQNEVCVNNKIFGDSDVDTQAFKETLVKAFYSPTVIEKKAFQSSKDARAEKEQTRSGVFGTFVMMWKRFKDGWHYLWDAQQVSPNDSFLKKIWYGNVDAEQKDEWQI